MEYKHIIIIALLCLILASSIYISVTDTSETYVVDVTGDETVFDDFDKDDSDDFDGFWRSLKSIPSGFADGIDNDSIGGNPFNQDLNTTDDATFNNIIISEDMVIGTDLIDADAVANTVDIVGTVTIDGDLTADNVFTHTYICAHTQNNISVTNAGTWINITFNRTESLKQGITHNHADTTNDTFTIENTGIYDLHGHASFEDSAANPDSNVCFRFIKNGVEIIGSLREKDLDKKDFDSLGSTTVLVSLTSGDKIKFQFTSDDTTVRLDSDFTYGDHRDTAVIKIKRIA